MEVDESCMIMGKFLTKPNERRGVERGVTSRLFCALNVSWMPLCFVALALLPDLSAAPLREVPAPSFGQIVAPRAAQAAPKPVIPLDELVYKDGDRVRGRFMKRTGDMLEFQSERFGLLRVRAAEADVILAKTPPPSMATAVQEDKKSEVAVERWPFSPLALTHALKDFFGA